MKVYRIQKGLDVYSNPLIKDIFDVYDEAYLDNLPEDLREEIQDYYYENAPGFHAWALGVLGTLYFAEGAAYAAPTAELAIMWKDYLGYDDEYQVVEIEVVGPVVHHKQLWSEIYVERIIYCQDELDRLQDVFSYDRETEEKVEGSLEETQVIFKLSSVISIKKIT